MILLQRFIATEHSEDTKTSAKVLQSKCHTYIKATALLLSKCTLSSQTKVPVVVLIIRLNSTTPGVSPPIITACLCCSRCLIQILKQKYTFYELRACFVGKRSTCKVAKVVRSTSWRKKNTLFIWIKRGRRKMWIYCETIVRNLTGQLRVLNTEIYKGQRSTSQPMADVSADISLHHICHEIWRFPNTCYVRGLLWRRSGSRTARFTNIE